MCNLFIFRSGYNEISTDPRLPQQGYVIPLTINYINNYKITDPDLTSVPFTFAPSAWNLQFINYNLQPWLFTKMLDINPDANGRYPTPMYVSSYTYKNFIPKPVYSLCPQSFCAACNFLGCFMCQPGFVLYDGNCTFYPLVNPLYFPIGSRNKSTGTNQNIVFSAVPQITKTWTISFWIRPLFFYQASTKQTMLTFGSCNVWLSYGALNSSFPINFTCGSTNWQIALAESTLGSWIHISVSYSNPGTSSTDYPILYHMANNFSTQVSSVAIPVVTMSNPQLTINSTTGFAMFANILIWDKFIVGPFPYQITTNFNGLPPLKKYLMGVGPKTGCVETGELIDPNLKIWCAIDYDIRRDPGKLCSPPPSHQDMTKACYAPIEACPYGFFDPSGECSCLTSGSNTDMYYKSDYSQCTSKLYF
jgi:hypothetical protein